MSFGTHKKVLYLRWNDNNLRVYIETLMAQLNNLLQEVFLCETDFVIKIC